MGRVIPTALADPITTRVLVDVSQSNAPSIGTPDAPLAVGFRAGQKHRSPVLRRFLDRLPHSLAHAASFLLRSSTLTPVSHPHSLPRLIALTMVCVTPNSAARRLCTSPAWTREKISKTAVSVSLAFGLSAPCRDRPWSTMSREFSAGVAHRRWRGLMQPRWPLPHAWAATCCSLGGDPCAASHVSL